MDEANEPTLPPAAAPDADPGGPDSTRGPTAPTPVTLLGERLSPRVVVTWYLADLLRATVLVALALFARETWLRSPGDGVPDWVSPSVLGLAGLFVVWTLIWPPLSFRVWRFSVDDEWLAMRYGVVFVEERRVPVPRMQHVDLVRGPIERLFGLATLVVFTAGNEGSAFRVPGLRLPRAEALRDRILRARGRDGV